MSSSNSREFCLRAIAHLKIEVIEDGPNEVVLGFADSPVLRSIGHGLLVAYFVDEGEYFSYVQNRHLAEASMFIEEMDAFAMRNLARFAYEEAEVRQYGNLFVVMCGGNFEASLLLCDQFWGTWYSELAPNGFVAAFPYRDILAFGDANNAAVMPELNALCGRNQGGEHPLTTELFRRVDGTWQPIARKKPSE